MYYKIMSELFSMNCSQGACMAEICDWSREGRGGSKLANHNLFQSNACIFLNGVIYNNYHDYLLVATAECIMYKMVKL